MYVIQRTDGLYITRPGHSQPYTRHMSEARTFPTRERAEYCLCADDERVVAISDLWR